jgi:hypothetical protein
MRIHIVACRVLTRELSALIAHSSNSVDVTWLAQGLHETPEVLHRQLVDALEEIYEQVRRWQLKHKPDVIVLGYGLCSKATVGIVAKDIPIVIPRTDDCIALFLGSEERYLEYFKGFPGTYWLNDKWVENSPEIEPDYPEKHRAELMEKYDGDEDTVEYLMSMDEQFTSNYRCVGYISSKVHNDPLYRAWAQGYAQRCGLDFMDVDGDDSYFKKIVDGDFNEHDFLTLKPGETVQYTDGPERMVAVTAEGDADGE